MMTKDWKNCVGDKLTFNHNPCPVIPAGLLINQEKEKQMKIEEVGLKQDGGTRGEKGYGMRIPSLDEATRPITPLDLAILKAECLVFPGTTTTVCCLTMKNGFHIIGMSDCVNPEEFDKEVGMKWAIQDARNKAEGYVAYLRKEERHRETRGVEGTSSL